MLLWPSVRSIAYLDVMDKINCFPTEIINMKNGFTVDDNLKNEWLKYGYNDFINLEFDINRLLRNKLINSTEIDKKDINSNEVIQAVKKLNNEYIIFTGGGILRKDILSLGKKFIHIHPGVIPNHRGSTCFYYSLLENNSLGATAYIMNDQIDSGEIIIQRKFSLNYFIKNDQSLFIDCILDNYIRSHTLKDLIRLFNSRDYFETIVKDCSNVPYYIMHPLLRHVTLNKINSNYSSLDNKGIIKN